MTATAGKLYSVVCWLFYFASAIKTLHMGGLLFGWSLLSYDGDLSVSLTVAVLSPLFWGGTIYRARTAIRKWLSAARRFLTV